MNKEKIGDVDHNYTKTKLKISKKFVTSQSINLYTSHTNVPNILIKCIL